MKTSVLEQDAVKRTVRERYARIAESGGGCSDSSSCCGGEAQAEVRQAGEPGCCDGSPSGCCSPQEPDAKHAQVLGYSAEDESAAPEGANLGLGCGNPVALASLKPGQVVLDLGSGAGFDAFLAARSVGPTGWVIGVDMTAAMITKARVNQSKGGYENVEFRLGEIESLPVADSTVDVILSNCVINLSPDKERVFREAFRVLKPGGRLAISDVVATAPIPEDLRKNWELYTGCVAGAAATGEVQEMLERAGFRHIRIAPKDKSRRIIEQWFSGRNLGDYVMSATIEAEKPAA